VGPDAARTRLLIDIAITRVIPRTGVIVPCDSIEAKKADDCNGKNKFANIYSSAREKTPIITTEDTPFEIGKAQEFFRSANPKVGSLHAGDSCTMQFLHQ